MITKEEAYNLQQIGKNKPRLWCEQVLGCSLWEKQSQIAETVVKNTRTTVRTGSGIGKSFVASCVALDFLYNFPPATVLTTAPTFRQVRDILWREISTRFSMSKVPLDGDLTQVGLNLSDDWFAIGLSTDEPERFQGFHNENVLVIADEASGLDPQVYAAIENPLSTGNSHLLLIGNPTQPVGEFRDSFTSELYRKFHISAFETPNFTEFGITIDDIKEDDWKDKIGDRKLPRPYLVTPQWVSERYKVWGDKSYLWDVYVMGNFPDVGLNTLIPLSFIEAACGENGTHEKANKDFNDIRVIGVDISRYGDDETVVARRLNNRIFELETWSHQDTGYTAGRVKRFHGEFKPDSLVIDAVGVGSGVADRLKEENIDCIEANVGQKALDSERYLNRRAELYDRLREMFVNGEISIPDDPILKQQLADIRYTYTPKGQLQIESKEEMRARGMKSPDRADAIMLSFIPQAESKRKQFVQVKYWG